MGVGARNSRNFPIQKSPDRNLLACGLRMHIHKDNVGFSSQPADFLFEKAEGIFQTWLHKCPALDVDHSNFALGGLEHYRAPPRGASRIIAGAQQTRLCFDVRFRLFLIPVMISTRYDRPAKPQYVVALLKPSPLPCHPIFS